MTLRLTVLAALLLAIPTSASLHAEAPKPGSSQSIPLDLNRFSKQPTAPFSLYLDAVYDYEVYSAPDVTGETEFVVIARFADDGQWDYVHRYEWIGTPDRGLSKVDRGVWKFTTQWNAYQAAENLKDDGEITDYDIIEQPKEPQWNYEGTFDTRSAAEDFANELEEWSQTLGVPHITKIVRISDPNLLLPNLTAPVLSR